MLSCEKYQCSLILARNDAWFLKMRDSWNYLKSIPKLQVYFLKSATFSKTFSQTLIFFSIWITAKDRVETVCLLVVEYFRSTVFPDNIIACFLRKCLDLFFKFHLFRIGCCKKKRFIPNPYSLRVWIVTTSPTKTTTQFFGFIVKPCFWLQIITSD